MSDLFDVAHYSRQAGLDLQGPAAWDHFRTEGDRMGLEPSPYFSTAFYKTVYPDWNAEGAGTAFEDFLSRIDQGTERRPHLLIDPCHYRAFYHDLALLGPKSAIHFMRHGDAESRSPSDGFDAGFYRRCYLPLGTGHPFRHYITQGAALGHLPRPEPQGPEASATAMRRATSGLARPFLLVAHDAQKAGVPILTLDLAQEVKAQGLDPVFLLGNAGPLLDQFRALGPVLIGAEGWDTQGLAQGLPPGSPAIVNTAAAAAMAVSLARAGLDCLLLIHEMADYVRDQGLMPHLRAAQAAGARLVVSMPRMIGDFAETGGTITHVQPGLRLPRTPLSAFRRARNWRQGRPGPVFIGAGHADPRKGFDLFLAAARRIAAHRPQASFVWLGALDPWAQALADAALADGLPLTLPGFVKDSLAWYRAADVYLLTSRQDPGPTTLAHAAAVGTPFVGYAADIGLIGLSEYAGRFLPPGDEAGLVAAALEAAGASTPATRRTLRRTVRAQTGFAPYVDALLAALTGCPASG